MKQKIVIIGSGFGGLAAAIRLQAKGMQVTLLEKNAKVGGHAYQLVKDGYTFDMGPSIITAPDLIRPLFECAGRRMEDYLNLVKLDPFYRIYFHDGTSLDYTDDSEQMKRQMAQFSADDADNYEHFMAHTRQLYDAVITDGLGATAFDLPTLLGFLPRALRLRALIPAYNFVKRYFDHPRHRFTFSFHPLFIGGNPFRAPAVYLMIPYLEKTGGVWFCKGGMYNLVRALEDVFKKLGGVVKTDAEVQQIIVENRRATGVIVKQEFYEADAVISNADLIHTYGELIQPEHRRKWSDKKLRKNQYSMSAFLLYLGVRKKYPQLKHHTLILSQRYKGLIDDIFDNKVLPDDFSMYLHIPSQTDPSMAPEGGESMYVLIPVPNLESSTNWENAKKAYTNKLLTFLEDDFGLTDLKRSIEVLETFTPSDFKRERNNHLGSAWGVEPKLTQTAYFRPHNRSEDIQKLYFVGASTHPGAGVPGVLLTAETTVKLVAKDLIEEDIP
ncbi:phytoene desaturase [Candidatus Poribacteria bacterium]|nr:phytoene desaturase [Candidatus Poribacteria bacterium]MYH83714.1 phytoene desaturase [Candidatus Poribacteria bacterium]MYK94750.1 phytoene desaturase [Candidatus Poribacteria bacterium]